MAILTLEHKFTLFCYGNDINPIGFLYNEIVIDYMTIILFNLIFP